MFVILEIKRFQHINMTLWNEIMNIDVDPQKLKGLSNGIMDIDDNVDIIEWSLSKFERIHHCGLIGYLYWGAYLNLIRMCTWNLWWWSWY